VSTNPADSGTHSQLVVLTEGQLREIVRSEVNLALEENEAAIAERVRGVFLKDFGRMALTNLYKLAGLVLAGLLVLLAGKGVLPK
jgi:hypothetical protein